MLFKIKSKFPKAHAISYLVLVVLVIGLAIWVLGQLLVSRLQGGINAELVSSFETASMQVSQSESKALNTERAIARATDVAEAVAGQDSAHLDALVRPLATDAPLVQIVDGSGALIYELHAAPQGSVADESTNFTAWRLARRVLAGESDSLGDKFSGVMDGTAGPSLYVAGPLIRDTQRVGVVMVGYPLDTLAPQALSNSAVQVTIYRPNGQPAFSTFPKGSSLPALTSETLATVNADSPHLLQNRAWTLSTQSYNEAIGPLLVRGQPSGWALAVAVPRTFIPASASLSPMQWALTFALAILAVLVLSTAIAKIIPAPVVNLDAEDLRTRGDLDSAVSEQANNEPNLLSPD